MPSNYTLRINRLLERALPVLRCPACSSETLQLASLAPGLECKACGRHYAHTRGILDLYTGPDHFTLA